MTTTPIFGFGMQTDRYELSMLRSLIDEGRQDDHAVFEVFTRRLQPGFRFGVFAGLGRLLDMIANFDFDSLELDWLLKGGVIDQPTYDYLYKFHFRGNIDAYAEGDLYFPGSPVLTVSGTLGECILLETLVLSVLNHDSSIASKAARMVLSANGRPIIEMGSRRTHEESAVAAARAAYIAGFASTSNLAAGYAYGIPTAGTAAHAFTLAHESEDDAFRAQIASQGVGTTLLVDTYDIEQGIRNACAAVSEGGWGEPYKYGPGAIRLDSGDLAAEAHKARTLLDSLGATDTRIVVTSDLDEYVMKDLAHAPIDGYGVGTQLVSTPPAGFVYKLVEINGRPVAKKAADKVSVGGRKFAYRRLSHGLVMDERYSSTPREFSPVGEKWVALQHPVVVGGKVNTDYTPGIHMMRALTSQKIATLPEGERKVWIGDFGPYLTATAF
jgi:putative nicotinate phosphoribosyltransferase